MLTISQLAAYAGVTVRAVRHYHQVGLLPEPERDQSGYRRYGAAAVVQLVKIRTLADAGVPLSRVPDLLDAGEDEFAAAVDEIDKRLRAEIRQLQHSREAVAKLTAGESLCLPPETVDYLEMLRDAGISEPLIAAERDAWILLAARWPEHMAAWMADKRRQFRDPRMVRLYQLMDRAASSFEEDVLAEAADLLAELTDEWSVEPQPEQLTDPTVVALLDSFADGFAVTDRLQQLLRERGWVGWTDLHRLDRDRSTERQQVGPESGH